MCHIVTFSPFSPLTPVLLFLLKRNSEFQRSQFAQVIYLQFGPYGMLHVGGCVLEDGDE